MATQLLTDANLKGIKDNGKTQWLHDNTGLYVKVGTGFAVRTTRK